MEDREILLRIKRKLSKKEEYRFLLRHLDNIEQELAKERKLNTELLKKEKYYKQDINDWKTRFDGLQGRFDKLAKKYENAPTKERHDQVLKEKRAAEKQYHEQVANNIQLQIQIDKLNAAKGLSEGRV